MCLIKLFPSSSMSIFHSVSMVIILIIGIILMWDRRVKPTDWVFIPRQLRDACLYVCVSYPAYEKVCRKNTNSMEINHLWQCLTWVISTQVLHGSFRTRALLLDSIYLLYIHILLVLVNKTRVPVSSSDLELVAKPADRLS